MAKVELRGWDRWSQRIESLIRNLDERNVVSYIQTEGDRIHNEMVRIAPVDTGFLRSHIKISHRRDGVKIESEAPYSLWVDRGTSKMAPQSFFRNPLILGIRRLIRTLRIKTVRAV